MICRWFARRPWWRTGSSSDDIVEGHLAQRSPMIEHEAAEPIEASEPHSAVVEAELPAPESAAVRYERERIDAWIRNRLIAYPLASCLLVASRSSRGRIGRRRRTARQREGAFSSGLSRRMARRAGSGGAAGAGARGLNLSEAKGRDVCAAPTLPVWPGPHPPPPLVAHLYAPYAPPPGVAPARPRR